MLVQVLRQLQPPELLSTSIQSEEDATFCLNAEAPRQAGHGSRVSEHPCVLVGSPSPELNNQPWRSLQDMAL